MRCTSWQDGMHCEKTATHRLICNGEKVPGAWLCEEHAREIVEEYTEKVPGQWEMLPIDELGKPIEEEAQ